MEGGSQGDKNRCLAYWAVYGCYRVVEVVADKFLPWLPFYHHAKLLFLLWLQLPSSPSGSSRPSTGAGRIYESRLRPFLLRYRGQIDSVLVKIDKWLGAWVRTHEAEINSVARAAQSATQAALQALDSAITPHVDPDRRGPIIEEPADPDSTNERDE
eukprot:TRINITY_DN33521_c0_g1_i2.p1 TRINITY_DN33521_c0_g1~~TRINITY_DN33521_c0_g1_i2.p1  ORF type:complete len:157 (-),score=1.66 TRINITY_DN33521_c0_g1_i2:85-555(-)